MLVAVIVVIRMIVMMRLNLTALEEPGHFETLVSNRVIHAAVRRADRRRMPPRPMDVDASAASGRIRYSSECGICHGSDGRSQTPIGRWMYPRAADLTSEQVQSFSDQELFWIIQNGIRFTGMPAFGKVESGDQIWNLVNYVRTLRGNVRSKDLTR